MATDKEQEGTKQKETQNVQHPINPFKDDAPKTDPQQQKAEDIALEQQRKEALTERD
ncbi:MAG TPA: hypothetical protein VM010_07545 [Chitinophagaceae bacterium]|nr:hypothetical protein [Chitinophagaceae bacterium]